MIMPWAKVAYELNHDLRALDTIERAANTLFSRYSSQMGCIRSWDSCVTKKYNFQDVNSDFMVIIVSTSLMVVNSPSLTYHQGQHDEPRPVVLCSFENWQY